MMTTAMLIIAAAISAMPILAAVLVSVGSKREDRDWSLNGKPRGRVPALARQILDFHTECTVPKPKSHRPATRPVAVAGRPANRRIGQGAAVTPRRPPGRPGTPSALSEPPALPASGRRAPSRPTVAWLQDQGADAATTNLPAPRQRRQAPGALPRWQGFAGSAG